MCGEIALGEALTINQIEDRIQELREAIGLWDELVLDTTEIETIDVAALQLLIAVKKECLCKGKRLVFKASAAVSNMMSLSGIEL